MISDQVVRQGEYIIDQSGAVDILINGYRTTTRGRPAPRNTIRCLLLGLFLTAHGERSCILTVVHSTLTTKLSLDTQVRIGVRDPNDLSKVLVSLHDFYNVTLAVRDKLSWLDNEKSVLDEAESDRRRGMLETFSDSVMDTFPTDWESTTMSIDATGIHAWGRRVTKADRARLKELGALTPTQRAAKFQQDPTLEQLWNKRTDLDARTGWKRAKTGADELFYGYHEHTMVLTPGSEQPKGSVPHLIHRFRVTPANWPVPAVTLNMIDTSKMWISDILVDRLYSHSEFEDWAQQLINRGINQHVDLRPENLGFKSSANMRWVAGVPHCPETPDELGGLSRPGPQATADDKEAFVRLIERREAYAMKAHTRPDERGKQRWECPAAAGKIGCSLRPGTVEQAVEDGFPIVSNPPGPETYDTMPICCVNATFSFTPTNELRKNQQPHYWGSRRWTRAYARRSSVEGSYGNRKNPATENLDRGQNQLFGIVWLQIINTMINASYNLRRLTSWAENHPQHPNAQHPLLNIREANRCAGPLNVTQDEYREIMKRRTAA